VIWPEDRHFHTTTPVEERELGCPVCGHHWYTDGREEYGWWEPLSEDDLYCPCCGVEGEA
jgi:hypothetical protein